MDFPLKTIYAAVKITHKTLANIQMLWSSKQKSRNGIFLAKFLSLLRNTRKVGLTVLCKSLDASTFKTSTVFKINFPLKTIHAAVKITPKILAGIHSLWSKNATLAKTLALLGQILTILRKKMYSPYFVTI